MSDEEFRWPGLHSRAWFGPHPPLTRAARRQTRNRRQPSLLSLRWKRQTS